MIDDRGQIQARSILIEEDGQVRLEAGRTLALEGYGNAGPGGAG